MKLQNMRRSETAEQIKLFSWAKMHEDFIPELRLMYHVPNEGKRNQGTGEILKAAGLKAGVPDICLPVARKGHKGLYIEMKYGKNKTTKAQKEFMALLREEGHRVEVAYSFEEARNIIRHYLQRDTGFPLQECEEAVKVGGYCEGGNLPFTPCEKCKFYKPRKEI